MFYFPNPGTPCLRILFDELLFTTHITYALWRPDYARLFAQAKLRKLRTTPKTDTLFCSSQSVLREAYGDPTAVTDELVECILKPGLQPGAAEVFLDFISYRYVSGLSQIQAHCGGRITGDCGGPNSASLFAHTSYGPD